MKNLPFDEKDIRKEVKRKLRELQQAEKKRKKLLRKDVKKGKVNPNE